MDTAAAAAALTICLWIEWSNFRRAAKWCFQSIGGPQQNGFSGTNQIRQLHSELEFKAQRRTQAQVDQLHSEQAGTKASKTSQVFSDELGRKPPSTKSISCAVRFVHCSRAGEPDKENKACIHSDSVTAAVIYSLIFILLQMSEEKTILYGFLIIREWISTVS
jgi:hypothetical protein